MSGLAEIPLQPSQTPSSPPSGAKVEIALAISKALQRRLLHALVLRGKNLIVITDAVMQ